MQALGPKFVFKGPFGLVELGLYYRAIKISPSRLVLKDKLVKFKVVFDFFSLNEFCIAIKMLRIIFI